LFDEDGNDSDEDDLDKAAAEDMPDHGQRRQELEYRGRPAPKVHAHDGDAEHRFLKKQFFLLSSYQISRNS
jgi:hypothetical protein